MWPLLATLVLSFSSRPFVHDVVMTRDDGALVSLDPSSGVARSVTPAGATDVGAAGGDRVWTIEPGGEAEGRIARWRRDATGFSLERSLPFDGADGRVIEASESPVVLALSEGATIARHGPNGAFGLGWALPASVLDEGDALVTLDADIAQPSLRRLTLGDSWVTLGPVSMPDVAPGSRLVPLGGEIAFVSVELGIPTLRASGSVFAGQPTSTEATVEDAIALDGHTVAALLGPSPHLVVLGPGVALQAELVASPFAHTPWPTHRLAWDEGRRRLWIATDHGAFVVVVGPSLRVFPLDLAATAVALLRTRPRRGTHVP
jgi:hypothetical protein